MTENTASDVGPGGQPLLRDPFQFSLVVPRVDDAVKLWTEVYGVGPWTIWNFDASNMTDMVVDGQPTEFGMRIAMTHWGPLELELIEPLDEQSVYAQSLRAHGGRSHFHHLHCLVDNYDDVLSELVSKGVQPRMSAEIRGVRFCYISTDVSLGCMIEIADRSDAWGWPPGDETYPATE